MGKKISVVIPAFNEEKGIIRVLEGINTILHSTPIEYELIVVNDGSTDGTAEELKKSPVKIHVVEHDQNKGYGASLISGIRASQFNEILIIDADGTYPPEDIPKLVNCMERYDMVVGARSGREVSIPLIRRPPKWLLNKLANYLAGQKIPDLNSGLRVLKRDIVFKYLNMLPTGFSFTTTITLALLTNNYNVKFIPISYRERTGRSKIRPFKDTLNFVQLIVRTVLYFSPLQIFLPLSLFLFAGFSLSLLRDLLKGNITDKTVMLFIAFLIILAIGSLADLIDKRIQ